MLVYVLNTSAGLREMFRSLELRMGLACVCVCVCAGSAIKDTRHAQ
jgi:hypothetical protein